MVLCASQPEKLGLGLYQANLDVDGCPGVTKWSVDTGWEAEAILNRSICRLYRIKEVKKFSGAENANTKHGWKM